MGIERPQSMVYQPGSSEKCEIGGSHCSNALNPEPDNSGFLFTNNTLNYFFIFARIIYNQVLCRFSLMEIPRSLEFLQEVLSKEEILLFAKHFAGQTIYIPAKLKTGHKLTICGEEICDKLTSNFSGLTVNVPYMSSRQKKNRNSFIHRYRKSGWTVYSLSLYFDLSSRQTFLILSQNV